MSLVSIVNDLLLDGEIVFDAKILRRPSVPFVYAWTCERCGRTITSSDLSHPWACTCGWTSHAKVYDRLQPA